MTENKRIKIKLNDAKEKFHFINMSKKNVNLKGYLDILFNNMERIAKKCNFQTICLAPKKYIESLCEIYINYSPNNLVTYKNNACVISGLPLMMVVKYINSRKYIHITNKASLSINTNNTKNTKLCDIKGIIDLDNKGILVDNINNFKHQINEILPLNIMCDLHKLKHINIQLRDVASDTFITYICNVANISASKEEIKELVHIIYQQDPIVPTLCNKNNNPSKWYVNLFILDCYITYICANL